MGLVRGEPYRFIAGHWRRTPVSVESRLDARSERMDLGYETLCRVWLGSRNPKGYGMFTLAVSADGTKGKRTTSVHIAAWENANGILVPQGYQVHHLCHPKSCRLGIRCLHRACSEPSHLTILTREEHRRLS